ncbi:hypothetical protein TMatcc_001378 [Talaromyces marneffei ATCC 18224]|uniref:uncharacterized protein n=1 Tax=Talaromyces marneffei TaxID=37727 RepID=UPI0012A9033B|nr:uncharacterized protein EYB26_007391 [Talaromyces marneffei]QGA19699.1 hypothetical protein EYB26_007391 [Talaromyces marneffei]
MDRDTSDIFNQHPILIHIHFDFNFDQTNIDLPQPNQQQPLKESSWQTSAPVTSSPSSKAPTVTFLPGAVPTATLAHSLPFGVANCVATTVATAAILPSLN